MAKKTSLIKIDGALVKINTLGIFKSQLAKGVEILQANKVINNSVELLKANDNLGKAKKLVNLLNKEVTNLCRPLKDRKKDIDDAQRTIKDQADELCKDLNKIIGEVEKAVLAFSKTERERVSKELEDQQNAIKEKENDIVNLSPLASEEFIDETKKAAEKEIIKPIFSAPIVKGLTVTWKYEIENPELVPRQYCSPDASKIQTSVRGGIREIPGVKIFSDETIRAGR